jgi:hypothetical protein
MVVGSQAVTPWRAKNRAMRRSPSGSASMRSTPTAPWTCRSTNPGMATRPSAASTSAWVARPAGGWPWPMAAIRRPSTAIQPRGHSPPGVSILAPVTSSRPFMVAPPGG